MKMKMKMTSENWLLTAVFFLSLALLLAAVLKIAKKGDVPKRDVSPLQEEVVVVPVASAGEEVPVTPEQAIADAGEQEALRLRAVEMYAEALWNGGLNTIILRHDTDGAGITWEALCSLADSEDEYLPEEAFKSWVRKRELARKIANAALKVAEE
jgi:hypothetical protein